MSIYLFLCSFYISIFINQSIQTTKLDLKQINTV